MDRTPTRYASEPPSSLPREDASAEEALAWYKSQYEQLEHELSDFQASSKELEAELERDLDAADKRESSLRDRAEALNFEVEEWKRKYRESKSEANAAQNTLEKEITTLRDTSRTLQLKLRDIEVANDDFERQARNTTSSLEDLESKYNVSIERGVMMEEEIRIGEQEREQLRVEAQRLREELSDLKIEAEILQDKIKKQESRHLSAISTDLSVLESSTFEHSPSSTASSPLVTTPPDMKPTPAAEIVTDPPSPPMSDASAPLPKVPKTGTPLPKTPASSAARTKSRIPSADHSITPKPKNFASSTSSARGAGSRIVTTTAVGFRTPAPRPSATKTSRSTSHKVPTSNSLSHVRSLTAQMQRLEARVQSARSRLPAPVATPPKASPRSSIMGTGSSVPSTVTIRSRKRGTSGSNATPSGGGSEDVTPTNPRQQHRPQGDDLRSSVSSITGKSSHVPRLSTGVSRLSFGPLPNRTPGGFDSESSRPSSRASVGSQSMFAAAGGIRPLSRTDYDHRSSMPPPRPVSRASGARTPLGVPRPRSSIGGLRDSIGYGGGDFTAEELEQMRSPSRQGTYSRLEAEGVGSGRQSGIPMPSSTARRLSTGPAPGGGGSNGKESGRRMSQKLADVGETY